nr:immunoglobulin heavy chain junction region [Macaca mulatta]
CARANTFWSGPLDFW